MPAANSKEEAWQALAVKAQDLARGGRPDEATHLLLQVPSGREFSAYVHETALAWIEVGHAYLKAQAIRAEELARLTQKPPG
jgi:hypothetical protein